MAKCPVCEADISGLYLEQTFSGTVGVSYNVNIVKDNLELTEIDDRSTVDKKELIDEAYYCPTCNAELAKSSDEAYNILKGGKQ